MDVDARFAAPGPLGHLRLWSGMVLANRPWKMLPAFKGAIAAAFATGAYVLAISSMWLLADAVGFWRLLLLMVTAIVAMVVWIIIAHHLWERPEDRERREWATLYNGVSVLTISAAVLLAYAILFLLLFVAAWIFVPGGYFQSTLKHPVGIGRVPDPELVGGFAGHGGRGFGSQPGGRGEGTRCLLRLPPEAASRGR